MSSTDRRHEMVPRLARAASIMGHGVVLVVCLGLLGSWTMRAAHHIGRWLRQPAVPAFGTVDIVYFYEPGCPACQMTLPVVDRLERRYPRYEWARVDISYPRGMELAEQYYTHYRVPEKSRGRIPLLFAGTRAFTGHTVIRDELPPYLLRTALTRPQERKAPAAVSKSAGAASAAIRERFASFRVAPVLVAGVVDSINPCAITTLLFFLSYLAFAGHKPRDLLGVGAAFTAGVFLTYALIGWGLLRLLHALPFTTTIARCVYPITGLATLVLAGVSFADYLKARRGQTADIVLQMPKRLKLLTHQAIRARIGPRQHLSAGRLAGAAFATAVVVSALEFTCTSQVYLPTLMYMVQVGGQRLRATSLLLLYNVMFVAPLIALFLLSYLGVSSRALTGFFARKIATTKLTMALLLAGFSFYLFAVTARML